MESGAFLFGRNFGKENRNETRRNEHGFYAWERRKSYGEKDDSTTTESTGLSSKETCESHQRWTDECCNESFRWKWLLMPAVSESQRRFMGMVLAQKRGQLKNPSMRVKKAASGISESDAKDFSKKRMGVAETLVGSTRG